MKIVVVTGGFDPLHSGHIEYFRAAKMLGDYLIVGLNSDEWLARKKGQPFMALNERRSIVGSLKDVHATMIFNDTDNSARDLLYHLKQEFPNDTIIFANGGDRTAVGSNAAENAVCESLGIYTMYGLGGGKTASSSDYLGAYVKRISNNS